MFPVRFGCVLGVDDPQCGLVRPFRVITSYSGNGYGVIRRLMSGEPLEITAPVVPPPEQFREGSLSRFCAEYRLVPAARTVVGACLLPPRLVVLLREDGGAELLAAGKGGPWKFLRRLQAEARRLGRRLTVGELRAFARVGDAKS